ncbi:MAG: hypothetical protein Q8N30_16645 [Methylococcales bacterium]|nr:hypothetical protein [Methylococcales bacterium]
MQKDICSLLSLSWDKFEDKDGFKDNYWIEDKIGDNVKILFILESPHVAEIIKKCPAIGNTGIAMSEILFGDDTPFGELIDTKPCFGIMNICNIPMQKLDYNNYRLSADTRKYYSDFLANDAFFQEFIENIDFLRSRIDLLHQNK